MATLMQKRWLWGGRLEGCDFKAQLDSCRRPRLCCLVGTLVCRMLGSLPTLKGRREAWSRGPEGDLEACPSATSCSNVARPPRLQVRGARRSDMDETTLLLHASADVSGQRGATQAEKRRPVDRKRSLARSVRNRHVDRCPDTSAGGLLTYLVCLAQAAKTSAILYVQYVLYMHAATRERGVHLAQYDPISEIHQHSGCSRRGDVPGPRAPSANFGWGRRRRDESGARQPRRRDETRPAIADRCWRAKPPLSCSSRSNRHPPHRFPVPRFARKKCQQLRGLSAKRDCRVPVVVKAGPPTGDSR